VQRRTGRGTFPNRPKSTQQKFNEKKEKKNIAGEQNPHAIRRVKKKVKKGYCQVEGRGVRKKGGSKKHGVFGTVVGKNHVGWEKAGQISDGKRGIDEVVKKT